MTNQLIKPLYIDATHLVPREADATDVVVGSYTDVAKEPSGFPNRTDSVLTFDAASRTFSISPLSNSFDVYVGGFKLTFTTPQSIQIPSSTGLYWVYFSRDTNAIAVFSNGPSPSDIILKHTPVAILYWNSVQESLLYFGDERHGIVMDSVTHAHLHQSLGAVYRSGFGLANIIPDADGSLNSHASFDVASGRLADEDIEITVPSTTSLRTFYRIGTEWYETQTSSEFPLFILNGGTLPAYNHYNGTGWILNTCQENKFILIHVVATNDFRNGCVCILGDTYSNKTEARAGALSEFLSLSGLPFSEFVPIGTVIYQCNSGYLNDINARIISSADGASYIDWRGSRGFATSSVESVQIPDTNPVFTYSLGNISRIDYSSGNYKIFQYDGQGNVLTVDYHKGSAVYRKTFFYDVDGMVTNIVETIL